jgi:hypothetical protein
MLESELGVNVAVTRQNGGSPVIGVEPGGVNTPDVLSVADVIVVSRSCTDWRLVHGDAAAGVPEIAVEANSPIAAQAK